MSAIGFYETAEMRVQSARSILAEAQRGHCDKLEKWHEQVKRAESISDPQRRRVIQRILRDELSEIQESGIALRHAIVRHNIRSREYNTPGELRISPLL